MSTTKTHRAAGTSDVLERRERPLPESDITIVRADGDDTPPRFTGHAAVFNSRTAIGNPLQWGWYEELADTAFDKTLNEADARFLIDHDSQLLVARKSAGDLRLTKDAIGLAVDADLDTELSYVRDFVRNLEKRRITGMSFGFWVVRDEWFVESVETSDGNTADVEVRKILEVRLQEVSGVTFPAYEDTDAGLRSVCTEVRAARNPSSPSRSAHEEEPAPADATRDDQDTAPTDEVTRGLRLDAMRADALAARYRL